MMKFIRHEGSEHTEHTIQSIKKNYIFSHLNSSNYNITERIMHLFLNGRGRTSTNINIIAVT